MGIDRVIELERENHRLTEALRKANAQAEHFERLWYLRGDEIEDLRELNDEMWATVIAANLLAPKDSGAYTLLGDAIRTLQPRWLRAKKSGTTEDTHAR